MNKSLNIGFLAGTLLGDSYTTVRGDFVSENVSLTLIKLKQQKLQEIKNRNYTIYERSGRIAYIGNRKVIGKTSYTIKAYLPEIVKLLRNTFYDHNGMKTITTRGLELLTLEGIAVWIMDDGYIDYKKQNHTKNLRICTDSFSEKSIGLAREYFHDMFGIRSKIYWHRPHAESLPKPRLSFNATNAQKLISLVFPYVLEDFWYKMDLHYMDKTLTTCRVSPDYKEIQSKIRQRPT